MSDRVKGHGASQVDRYVSKIWNANAVNFPLETKPSFINSMPLVPEQTYSPLDQTRCGVSKGSVAHCLVRWLLRSGVSGGASLLKAKVTYIFRCRADTQRNSRWPIQFQTSKRVTTSSFHPPSDLHAHHTFTSQYIPGISLSPCYPNPLVAFSLLLNCRTSPTFSVVLLPSATSSSYSQSSWIVHVLYKGTDGVHSLVQSSI